jgi:hypothetical protein
MSSGGVTVVRTEQSVEIVADLDRRRLEMLTLELRRFARRHGLELRVEHGPRGNERRADASAPDSPR